jgi:hypothetical protein
MSLTTEKRRGAPTPFNPEQRDYIEEYEAKWLKLIDSPDETQDSLNQWRKEAVQAIMDHPLFEYRACLSDVKTPSQWKDVSTHQPDRSASFHTTDSPQTITRKFYNAGLRHKAKTGKASTQTHSAIDGHISNEPHDPVACNEGLKAAARAWGRLVNDYDDGRDLFRHERSKQIEVLASTIDAGNAGAAYQKAVGELWALEDHAQWHDKARQIKDIYKSVTA